MVGDKVWIRQDSIPYTFDLLTELFYNQYGNRIPLVQVKDTLRGVLFNNLFSQLPELYALMEAQNSVMMARIKDNGFGETYVQSGSDTTSRVGNVKQVGDRVNIDSTSDNEHAYDYETEGTFRDSINSGKSSSDQNSKSDQTVTYGKQTTKTTSRVFEYLSDAQIGGLIIKWLENFNPLFQTIAAQNANCISPGLAEFIQLNFSWSYITGVPNDNGAFVSYMKDFRSYLASTYMPKFWIDSNAEYGLYWDRDQLNRPVLRAAISEGVVTDLTQEVKKNTESIKDHNGRITLAENAILNLDSIANANTSDIEILQSNISDLESRDEDLQTQINANSEQISENASNITQNTGDIDTLRNDLGDLGNIQNHLIQELQKLIDKVAKGQILHIEGPYNVSKTYAAGALVIGNDSAGQEFLWLSLKDNNTGNPLTDDSEWWYKLLRTGVITVSLQDYYNKQAIDTMLTQYATVAALQALNTVVNQNKTDIANLKNNKADKTEVAQCAKLNADNTYNDGVRNIFRTLPEVYTQSTLPTKNTEFTTKKYVDDNFLHVTKPSYGGVEVGSRFNVNGLLSMRNGYDIEFQDSSGYKSLHKSGDKLQWGGQNLATEQYTDTEIDKASTNLGNMIDSVKTDLSNYKTTVANTYAIKESYHDFSFNFNNKINNRSHAADGGKIRVYTWNLGNYSTMDLRVVVKETNGDDYNHPVAFSWYKAYNNDVILECTTYEHDYNNIKGVARIYYR